MNRRKSREIAIKLLFEMSINKSEYEEILEIFKENSEIDLVDIDFDYVSDLINKIQDNKELVDTTIEKNLTKWKIDRLSKVDLSILRVCTAEILFREDIPNIASINEGIEFAKKYSSKESSSFINAVLDNIIKK